MVNYKVCVEGCSKFAWKYCILQDCVLLLTKCNFDDQVQEMRWLWHVACMGERIFVGQHKGRSHCCVLSDKQISFYLQSMIKYVL
jgi:hypothetical protein